MKKKTIVIIQFYWRICPITTNLIKTLVEKGYKIIFFGYNSDTKLVDMNPLEKMGVEFYLDNVLEARKIEKLYNNFLQYVFNKVYKILVKKNRFILEKFLKFIPDNSIVQTKIIELIKKKIEKKSNELLAVIGIEKQGLIYAAEIAEYFNVSSVYYSLELYTDNHPFVQKNIFRAKLTELEKKYHKKCSATIIQDNDRAELLFSNNNVSNKKIFMPVYSKGSIIKTKHNYFYRKFNIPENKKIILYFGVIIFSRLIKELIEFFECVDQEKYVLVIHGPLMFDIVKYNFSENIYISEDLVDEDRIFDLVSSAYIGIAIYRQVTDNEKLTAFSSTKIAQYFRCGIPVITWNNFNYQRLMSEFQCGELIDSFEHLNTAVNKISLNYDKYKIAAFSAYNKYYNIDTTIENLTSFLGKFEE
ncbi:hypothetical protein KA977_05310 [Candidatus Dependentiae bacterium]|nr:hypothetical protein [Candidatus Dependentiae bacterium]